MNKLFTFLFSTLFITIINAGTIVVQNINDSGVGSLRQATIDAIDGDTIRFTPSLISNGSDTIQLSSEIAFNKGLVFKGLYNATDSLFISGEDAVRIFNVDLDTAYIKALVIDSLIFINGNASNGYGGAVNAIKVDTLLVLNSIFHSNHAESGGAVYYAVNEDELDSISSFVKIINSNYINNTSVFSGGGVFIKVPTSPDNSSTIEVDKSNFISNISGLSGGGFSCYSPYYDVNFPTSFKIKVQRSNFYNNQAVRSGGGLIVSSSFSTSQSYISYISDTTIFIDSCNISGNHCDNMGGGVYLYSPKAKISSSIIDHNISGQEGGGVWCSHSLNIDKSSLSHNVAHAGAGLFVDRNNSSGFYSDSIIINVLNSQLNDNQSSGLGGAIYTESLISRGRLRIESCEINRNTASRGGGIKSSCDFIMNNSSVEYNSSRDDGGGLYLSSLNAIINNSTLYRNTTADHGGGIYREGTLTINNSTIVENSVDDERYSNGGGIHLESQDTLTVNNSTIINNFGFRGGGISTYVSIINIKSSIIALNENGNIQCSYYPTINSEGDNIFTDSYMSGRIGSDQLVIDTSRLNFLPIDYYGGETKTMLPGVANFAIDEGNPLDFSDAQNGSFIGRRDVGAAESCISSIYDTVITCNDYYFAGQISNTSGIYYDSLTNMNGCDSVITLHLTITAAIDTLPIIYRCEGDSIEIFDRYRFTSGVYKDSLTQYVVGCNGAIITVQELVVLQPYQDTLPIQIVCLNDSIQVFGDYVSTGGFYYDSLTTVNGCDSVTVQKLEVLPSYQDTLLKQVVCLNDSIQIFGHFVSIGSFYYDSLTTMNGCDSILIQELVVLPPYQDTFPIQYICLNDSVLIFGNYESIAGLYYDSLTTMNGCDSTLIQELVVLQPYQGTLSVQNICSNDSILIFGNYERIAGLYYDSLITVNGCDSVTVQELVVLLSYQDTSSVQFMCSNDSVLIFGNYESITGFYYDSLATIDGCDSIIIQELIIYPIDLTVSQSNYQIISNQTNANYQWIDCSNGNVFISGASNQNFEVIADGDYAVIVTTANCSDTSECISVNGVGIAAKEGKDFVSIYPNPTNDSFIVGLNDKVKENTNFIIYDIRGKVLKERTVLLKETTIDISHFSKGVYFLRIIEDGIEKGRVKIIKE